ncbi:MULTISPECIES: ATP-binding protein [unclassified Fusibacter]|uniref:sensor histidine kinase n=1 Tax=unclassified Fusibacter TaxID=2624464 RepID=UPI001013B2AD|nr:MULTISPECIES: ATP-binding protein [unclassified Fusibacter]MCK8058448.1 ATP-binding protein [Fusibacter sp. A2]NPE22784.1 hypothetical protein [Fusibacter sp. A1]RXV60340.1 hypothetical protein DWB64_13130 [Fusibacter sp. A1]
MKKTFILGKVLSSFILLSLILPLLIISLVAMNFTQSFLLEEAKNNNRQIVENLKTSVEVFFDEPSNTLKLLRDLLISADYLNQDALTFSIFNDNVSHFDHYMIIDRDGIVEFSYPEDNNIIGFDNSSLEAFKKISSGVQEYWSKTYLGTVNNEVSIDYALPLGDKTLVGTIHLKRFIELYSAVANTKDLIIGITDSTGTYILHTDYGNVEQRITDPYVNKRILNYDKVSFENMDVYGTTLLSDYEDWHVVSYEPVSHIRDRILTYTIILSMIIFITILVVSVIASRIIHLIKASLQSVLDRTDAIAKGNYELIDSDNSFKEFEEISKNFSNMANQIKSREDEILDKNEEILAMNENLETRVSERTLELTNINHELIATIDDLEATKAQLVEAEKLASLGSLVAGLAHEINTPLGIILTMITYEKSLIDELEHKIQSEQVSEIELKNYLQSIKESEELIYSNVTRTCDLINTFKDISKDQTQSELRKIQLSEYLESILISLKPKLKESKLQVNLEIQEEVEMITYPGSIYQVLVNLLFNASIHAYENNGGKIDLTIRKSEDKVRFIIQDYGKGIQSELISKIFDPFFTTARGAGGTGLGLNITYNIIKQILEGTIQCESILGQGAKFTIVLPRALKNSDSDNLLSDA